MDKYILYPPIPGQLEDKVRASQGPGCDRPDPVAKSQGSRLLIRPF